jgi:predicted AAA+ superfamily ATPase
MNSLFPAFYQHLDRISTDVVRYLYPNINWDARLIAITGSRGCGKTTFLLQHVKMNFAQYPVDVLYASCDNMWFASNSIYGLADSFRKNGGKLLLLDEVHKYRNWSREIKNIYDEFYDLKVVFTGSSMLEIYKAKDDLSRRASVYYMCGLSFREFIKLEYGIDIAAVTLDDILKNHVNIAMQFGKALKPLPAFAEYLRMGYYPFYREDKALYHEKLLSTLNITLETDLPAVESIDYHSINKIRKLFVVLSKLVPFTPNISQLSTDLGITRKSLMNYLYFLEKAQAILTLHKEASGISVLVKPEKIYLNNANYIFALGGEQSNTGNIRETFFFNQMKVKHTVTWSDKTDFVVDNKYSFEIGGKNKTGKQLKNVSDGYLALDNIELGFGNQIPLWLFGLMY